MPIIKSAKKRVKVAEKAAVRNSKTKRSLKDAVKAFQAAITSGNAAKMNETLVAAQSAVDTAEKKNIIHKNKAARKKAQLAKQMKEAGAKLAKAPAKKATPAAKKPAAKKPAAKTTAKPAAKKAPAKKPAAKK